MAQLLSGYREGASASFSDVMALNFGNAATLFNIIKRQGRSGLKFNGSVKEGHTWVCDDANYTGDEDNARTEAQCGINGEDTPEVLYKNHLQIFSKDTEISGSAEAESGTCARPVDFKMQQNKNRLKLALDIDAALASDRDPVQREGKTIAGKMAGIKHYVTTANTFDMAGEALNVDTQITKMVRAIVEAGIIGEKLVLLAGSDVFDDITTFYSNKARLAPGDKVGGMAITKIITAWGEVEVMSYHRFAADEFMVFAPRFTAFIPFREIKGKEIDISSCDGTAEQDLTECTLQACPSALTWAKSAGRAKVCSDC